MMNSTSLDPI